MIQTAWGPQLMLLQAGTHFFRVLLHTFSSEHWASEVHWSFGTGEHPVLSFGLPWYPSKHWQNPWWSLARHWELGGQVKRPQMGVHLRILRESGRHTWSVLHWASEEHEGTEAISH